MGRRPPTRTRPIHRHANRPSDDAAAGRDTPADAQITIDSTSSSASHRRAAAPAATFGRDATANAQITIRSVAPATSSCDDATASCATSRRDTPADA